MQDAGAAAFRRGITFVTDRVLCALRTESPSRASALPTLPGVCGVSGASAFDPVTCRSGSIDFGGCFACWSVLVPVRHQLHRHYLEHELPLGAWALAASASKLPGASWEAPAVCFACWGPKPGVSAVETVWSVQGVSHISCSSCWRAVSGSHTFCCGLCELGAQARRQP